MTQSRREFIRQAAAAAALPMLHSRERTEQAFEPTWESLSRYRAPAWFRDAKLGLWAHWGPQCQPERGDWYARRMYIQGEPQHAHHVETYGHPSRAGFIEIIGRWKAERWDPERLMTLFQRAGARYMVAMANHHDNLDLFDSRHHAWNSVRVGPKQDIVGRWARIARERGIRFGVSNHSAHAWHWFQTAYGYDPEGPMAGVRYDAARLTRADGAGTWWEGLDPRELYGGPQPGMVLPDGFTSAKAAQEWHWRHDGEWIETPPPHDPELARRWLLRCNDLVDRYRPDFLYFDDYELPLGRAGLEATAHFYNQSMRWHGGALEAVVTAKRLTPEHRRAVVETYERGGSDTLQALPWQTDTCLGDWHYDRDIFLQHRYKSADAVIKRLADVVSKNGNLLLSVPIRGDGTIDEDEVRILEDMAAWMAVNGEAIHSTRTWRTFGEGPTQVAAGMQNEGQAKPFTARDVRFTTRRDALYALVLGWPEDGRVTIASLASHPVRRVSLLGGASRLEHRQDERGLTVTLPERRPPGAVQVYTLEIV
ncbi:MAG: alpha-L-fucosidase [Gemmatimonadaceae bacterium]